MRWAFSVLASGMAVGCGTILSIEESPSTPVGARDGGSTDAASDAAAADAKLPDGGDSDAKPDAGLDASVRKLRVFVTAATFDGALGNPDVRCAAAAAAVAPPLGGTFVAWISIGVDAARNKDVGPGPWYTLNGDFVAGTVADLNGGTLAAPINVDETKQTLGGAEHAWTGSNFVGQSSQTCTSWSTTSATGAIGLVAATTDRWKSETAAASCGEMHHLFCFERP